MINYIFSLFIIIGIIYGITNNTISLVSSSIFESGSRAIELIISLVPLLCLWLGLMKIVEKSGLLDKISKMCSYIIRPIFPDINKNSESIFYISSNIVMNMLGLGNAATPFGLKAMESMQKENNNKDIASRSMITFLVINTASVTLIPTTVISIRAKYGNINPGNIIPASIIVTILSLFIGLVLDRIFYYIWSRYD